MLNARRSDADRDALVAQHSGLVYWALKRLRHYPGVRRHREDCRAGGFLGLVRAAAMWDETTGFKFSTYASRCIISGITRQAFICTRRSPVQFSQLSRDDDDRAFDPAGPEAADPGPEEDLDHLAAALARLRPQHRQVLVMLYGLDQQGERPLREVGAAFGFSGERARQVEEKALALMACELARLNRIRGGSHARLA